MNKARFALNLPQSIKTAAERLAREDGVSLNQFIAIAVAQKVTAVETASVFLRDRAANATAADLKRALGQAGEAPPVPGDELPEEVAAPTRRVRKKS